MANYIAIIHKDSDSDYGVSFPDFPGCITAGKTIDEAKDMAQEALTGHIGVMEEFGDKVPEPSNLESVMTLCKDEEYVAFFIVSLPEKRSKKVRVNIMVPEEDLNQIDSFVKQHGMTRSAFLVKAAQDSIQTSSHS